jgi:hypothetical protein
VVLGSRKELTSLGSLFLPKACQGRMKVIAIYAYGIAVADKNQFCRQALFTLHRFLF